MPATPYELPDLTPTEVQEKVKIFLEEEYGYRRIECDKQPDGNWTIKAS